MTRRLICSLTLALAAFVLTPQTVVAQKDRLTVGIRLEPPHLDPTAGAAAAIDEVVYANVFEGLTKIDRDGGVKPALAESWTVSDDGKVYTFKLREGVKFHDGTAFDASDVVFSIERAMADDSVNAQKALFAPVEQVEALDPLTVRLTLKTPAGNILFNLGWGDAVIVAPETAADNKTNPVGTGPFRFSRWVKGDRIELVHNGDYWGTAAGLARATFKIIADPAAAFSAMMAEDVDGFPIFPAPENLQQFAADPRFQVIEGSTEGETILAMNNGREPFSDIRVRRALSHAIDRKAIIDGAMFGYGTPIGTHFAPHHPAYVDLTDKYPFDPEKAKALLKEAGYPDGFRATIKLPPPSYARRGGEIIAAQLREIGIELKIVPLEWAQWLKEVFKETNYDLTIVSHTEPLDIGIYARENYYFVYNNPDFNAVIEKLNVTSGETDRYALFAEAQNILAEDAVNVFLFQLAKAGVWNAKLRGMWKDSPVQAIDLTEVHWTE